MILRLSGVEKEKKKWVGIRLVRRLTSCCSRSSLLSFALRSLEGPLVSFFLSLPFALASLVLPFAALARAWPFRAPSKAATTSRSSSETTAGLLDSSMLCSTPPLAGAISSPSNRSQEELLMPSPLSHKKQTLKTGDKGKNYKEKKNCRIVRRSPSTVVVPSVVSSSQEKNKKLMSFRRRLKHKRPPAGWDKIEDTIEDFEAQMRDVVAEGHEGERRAALSWKVHRVHWEKNRFIFDLVYVRKVMSRELVS